MPRAYALLFLLAGFGASAAPKAKPQQICLPRARSLDTRAWPICAIYMHGLFGSPAYPVSRWERPFRDSLEKIAIAKRCRIAVPIADANGAPNHNWNVVKPIDLAVARGAEACAPADFVARPSLIGFSNGANKLRQASCTNLASFDSVTLIGPTTTRGNERVLNCGNVTIIQRHDVPPLNILANAVAARETSH